MTRAGRTKAAWASKVLFAAVVLLDGVLAGAASGPASRPVSQPASGPTTQKAKVQFALARAIKQPVSKYSLAELAKMWPAFKHEPFETAGFNHFTLPFQYESADGTGDANEANAFSFLLSHSLDWAPGCYCARHAYFAFKRARKHVLGLRSKYDRRSIRFLVNDWSASHAVGGTLRRSKEGYWGELEIYDQAGKLVLKKKYQKPREFFDLLGDMSVDAMKHFGHKPSPALVKLLHMKRCNHHQSIIDLGRAAFVKEKSEEEFAIYRKILERDPGFADVRYWWSNQRFWAGDGRADYVRQMGLVMQSYLVEAAVWDFDPRDCPDKKLAAKYETWFRQAEKLVGRDFPSLLYVRLERAERAGNVPAELLERGTRVAAKYPNDYLLLYHLGMAYEKVADSDMGASVYIAALRGPYLANTDHLRTTYGYLARCMKSLGHNDIAAQLLIPVLRAQLREGGMAKAAWSAMLLGKVLDNMGWHARAVKCYRTAFKGTRESWRNEMLARGGIAAALAGRDDILAQILRDRRKEADQTKMTFLLEAYANAMAHKPWVELCRKKPKPMPYWGSVAYLLFCPQMGLIEGQDFWYRDRLAEFLVRTPNERPAWILLDAFDRRKPKAESASFYDMIEWLHGNDPWVKQAVADCRRRAGKPVVLGADALMEKLKAFKPVGWPRPDPAMYQAGMNTVAHIPPGSVSVAVRRLIRAGNFDKARELALRHHHLAVDIEHFPLRAHCNHLIHLIEQARNRARRRKAAPKPDRESIVRQGSRRSGVTIKQAGRSIGPPAMPSLCNSICFRAACAPCGQSRPRRRRQAAAASPVRGWGSVSGRRYRPQYRCA